MPDSVLLDPPPVLSDSGSGGRHRGRDDFDGDGGRGPGDGSGDPGALPISNARLIVILGLIASTMFFSALVGSLVFLRGSTPVWPPPGTPPLPPLLWVNGVLVVASSATLVLAHVAQRRGRGTALRLWLAATLLLAGGFLALQLHFWHGLEAAGFRMSLNNFAGKYYLLTYAHFAHALAGFVLLLLLTLRTLAGAPAARLSVNFDICAYVWHFVDVAWISLWLIITN
jgi:cytochrome c oxidase subunit 3